LERLPRINTGIRRSTVNFLKKQVHLTFDHRALRLREVVELLASIGYAPAINLASLDRKESTGTDKRLLFQLAVAGFGFGNVMLLSFPEYLGMETAGDAFGGVFAWLNFLLATPVAFYSGLDYLAAGWHSLRRKAYGIDIPLALGILVLYTRSVTDIMAGWGPGYMDSLTGLVFFLLVGKWFQRITYDQISFNRDYRSYFPVAATRLTPAVTEGAMPDQVSVPLDKLVPGDRLLVRFGELIPADGELLRGVGTIDYSFVTGEAEPIERRPGERVYAGGKQLGESLEIRVVRKVSESYLTQLWNESSMKPEQVAPASQLANQVGRYFTVLILLVAVGTLAYWLWADPAVAFHAFTAVLIVACPCAAALTIPFTLGNAVRMLARNGFYLKNTSVLERLRRFDAVVFDKTGTLTRSAENKLRYAGTPLSGSVRQALDALANESGHPISMAVRNYVRTGQQPLPVVSDFMEYPGQGIRGTVAGKRLMLGTLGFVLAGSDRPERPDSASGHAFLREGNVFLSVDGILLGSFSLQAQYRPQAWDVLGWFRATGYQAYLLSGDQDTDRELLRTHFEDETTGGAARMFFGQRPLDKLQFIGRMQAAGQVTLMIGDGLNDAGALMQSDVGIVMTEDTNNFTPAADAILDAQAFPVLPDLLSYAGRMIRVVYATWVLAAVYNVIGLSFAVRGLLSPVVAAVLMPLSSVSIVAFGVGLGTLLAKRMLPKDGHNGRGNGLSVPSDRYQMSS
jgi:Cu+-exporting ATPase